MIYILSGPVQSGKTTILTHFTQQNNCQGILAPTLNGLRVLKCLSTHETIPFQKTVQTGADDVLVGKYIFDARAFEWANKVLMNSSKAHKSCIVIDEAGKLELKGEGLNLGIQYVLANLSIELDVILVVRDYLLADIIKHYTINEYVVLDIDSLEQITLL